MFDVYNNITKIKGKKLIISKIYNSLINNQTQQKKPTFCGLLSGAQVDLFETSQKFSPKYHSAKKYLEARLSKLASKTEMAARLSKSRLFQGSSISIKDFNLDLLDGIQEGIKVFEGLSMKKIHAVFSDLEVISLSRGCRNNCSHCLIPAKIPFSKNTLTKQNLINDMLWDDYLALTQGFKELKNRLGFDFAKTKTYMAAFEDADPINLKSYDKKGKAHNAAEAIKIMYETFQTRILFDTSGWFKNDKWSKKAAEELVEWGKQNPSAFDQFNISINPFHGIMAKSIELKKQKKFDSAQKLRNLYIERMVDTMLTLSPIEPYLNRYGKNIGFMLRHAPNRFMNKGYKRKDLEKLFSEILKRYEEKFLELSPEKQKELKPALLNFKNQVAAEYEAIVNVGKGRKFFYFPKMLDLAPPANRIDANGKLYAGKIYTGLQLNFENKNKKTAQIYSD